MGLQQPCTWRPDLSRLDLPVIMGSSTIGQDAGGSTPFPESSDLPKRVEMAACRGRILDRGFEMTLLQLSHQPRTLIIENANANQRQSCWQRTGTPHGGRAVQGRGPWNRLLAPASPVSLTSHVTLDNSLNFPVSTSSSEKWGQLHLRLLRSEGFTMLMISAEDEARRTVECYILFVCSISVTN